MAKSRRHILNGSMGLLLLLLNRNAVQMIYKARFIYAIEEKCYVGEVKNVSSNGKGIYCLRTLLVRCEREKKYTNE